MERDVESFRSTNERQARIVRSREFNRSLG